MACSIKRFQSLHSPRIATNTFPGFTRRESYSTPVTGGFPLCAETSTPSRSSRKFIAVIVLESGKQPETHCTTEVMRVYALYYDFTSPDGPITRSPDAPIHRFLRASEVSAS